MPEQRPFLLLDAPTRYTLPGKGIEMGMKAFIQEPMGHSHSQSMALFAKARQPFSSRPGVHGALRNRQAGVVRLFRGL
jgi:hypothetical protein